MLTAATGFMKSIRDIIFGLKFFFKRRSSPELAPHNVYTLMSSKFDTVFYYDYQAGTIHMATV